MLSAEVELKSILTIAKAVRNNIPVYASIPGRSPRERVKNVKGCFHLKKYEVLTVFGWNHPDKVWTETGESYVAGN